MGKNIINVSVKITDESKNILTEINTDGFRFDGKNINLELMQQINEFINKIKNIEIK